MSKKDEPELDIHSNTNWRLESAEVGDDPFDPEKPTEWEDAEQRRRYLNQRRRFQRRQRRRRAFNAQLEEEDPKLYEEMLELRRVQPQKWRQKLLRIAVKRGWYGHRKYMTQDKPPELMMKYAKEDEEDG